MNKRPRSFAELSQRIIAGECDFSMGFAELLDTIFATPDTTKMQMLVEDPAKINAYTHELWTDAYLGATAEHLCRIFNMNIPAWTEQPERYLHRPYFATGGLESLKAMYIIESPLSFRKRLIFTSAHPLARA